MSNNNKTQHEERDSDREILEDFCVRIRFDIFFFFRGFVYTQQQQQQPKQSLVEKPVYICNCAGTFSFLLSANEKEETKKY